MCAMSSSDITLYLQQIWELLPDDSKHDPLRLVVLEKVCEIAGPHTDECYDVRHQWQELREQGIVGTFAGAMMQVMSTWEPSGLSFGWPTYDWLDLPYKREDDPDIAAAEALIKALKEVGKADQRIEIDFSYCNLPRESVVEMARLPSGRIVVMTANDSYWFEADGKSPKGSYLVFSEGGDQCSKQCQT